MRARLMLVRAGPLAALVALCTLLLLTSSLQRLLPVPAHPLVPLVTLLVAFLPALLTRGSPLPATLAVVGPVLILGSYGASRLDWLRTLKNFDVVDDAGPNLFRLGLSLLVLLVAWGLHALDVAYRLRLRSAERGILPAQGKAAWRVSLRRSAILAGVATLGTLAAAGLLMGAALVGPALLPVERMAFVAPLAAAVLVAVAALLLVGVPRRENDPPAR